MLRYHRRMMVMLTMLLQTRYVRAERLGTRNTARRSAHHPRVVLVMVVMMGMMMPTNRYIAELRPLERSWPLDLPSMRARPCGPSFKRYQREHCTESWIVLQLGSFLGYTTPRSSWTVATKRSMQTCSKPSQTLRRKHLTSIIILFWMSTLAVIA